MELFSASGKSFSKNSELKLFMRFWKFSSDFKVEFQASNVEECKEIQNQVENGSLKADEFLAVVDISFKIVASQMENSGFDIIKEFSIWAFPASPIQATIRAALLNTQQVLLWEQKVLFQKRRMNPFCLRQSTR